MNIFVCVKQVMARDSVLRLNDEAKWIQDDGLTFEMNEPDTYALEEGLRLKEKHGGEVVAITAGPARAASTIREALAKGADRGIHIEDDRYVESDTHATAQALAAAIALEPHDLILTGLQSDDAGFGQTGVILAQLLGLPHATIIMEIDASGDRLRCKRELEAGWFQTVKLRRPALLTIQSGINKVRYATLMGIKRARRKPFRRYSPEDLGIGVPVRQLVRRLYPPQQAKRTEFLKGGSRDVARQLLAKLRFEARVL
jgi:electron transfer flavoprotein beta subunit